MERIEGIVLADNERCVIAGEPYEGEEVVSLEVVERAGCKWFAIYTAEHIFLHRPQDVTQVTLRR